MTNTIIMKICSPPLHQSNVLLLSLFLFASDGLHSFCSSCFRAFRTPVRSPPSSRRRQVGFGSSAVEGSSGSSGGAALWCWKETTCTSRTRRWGRKPKRWFQSVGRHTEDWECSDLMMCWNCWFTASAAARCQKRHRGLALARASSSCRRDEFKSQACEVNQCKCSRHVSVDPMSQTRRGFLLLTLSFRTEVFLLQAKR